MIQSLQTTPDPNKCNPTYTPSRTKPVLFLVNPKSGSGRANTLFKKKILPIMQEADIEYEMVVTTHKNHGKEFIINQNLLKWSSIVIGNSYSINL